MKKKEFDCVQMKHEIQQGILKEMEGLTPEEQRRWTEESIAAHPILGPFWKKARKVQTD
jgi:hypothetical protein